MPNAISDMPNRQGAETINMTETLTKGMGLSEKAAETVKEVAAILGGRNVSVNTTQRTEGSETGLPTGATGVPALDNPDDIKQLEQNLEKLLSYLQMDNQERQAQLAKDRINVHKDMLETERNHRSEKIDKSLKDMEKAAKSRKINKIFGWIMTAIAVIAAAVACVMTGGVAVGAVVGAGLALGAQILNETGVMDKITSALAKALEKAGCSKMAAAIIAQLAVVLVILVASVGAGACGAASKAAETSNNLLQSIRAALEAARPAIKIGTTIFGVASVVSGGVAAYQNFESGISQSETTETQKYLAALQQMLSESEEELEKILQELQSSLGQVMNLLTSATDTSAAIAQNLGSMA